MLARLQKSMKEKDQGFTLIELLVVIIIIGILAAIAIPVFLNQRKKGVDASIESDLKNMATVQETYMTQNPTDLDGVAVTADAAGGAEYTVGSEKFRASSGNFISVTPDATDGGYCIKGWNDSASSAKTLATAMTYDSRAGGLGQGTGACTP